MARRTPRLHTAANLLTAGGVLVVATSLLGFLRLFNLDILFTLAAIATFAVLAIAMFLLSQVISHRIARPALIVAGVGFVTLVVTTLAALPGLPIVGELLAGAGMIVAAIIALQNSLLPRRSAVGFVVASIAGALYLLGILSFAVLIFGVALIVTGILLLRDE